MSDSKSKTEEDVFLQEALRRSTELSVPVTPEYLEELMKELLEAFEDTGRPDLAEAWRTAIRTGKPLPDDDIQKISTPKPRNPGM
jgi:hypothetical protein